MFNFKKINFYFVLSVILGFLVGLVILFLSTNFLKPKYVMVVLEGGNIYFGEKSFFSVNKLYNPVFLTQDQNGNFSLQRFSEAIWAPKNFIYLNPNKILFWTYLKDDSAIINFIKNRNIQQSTPKPTLQQTPQQTPQPTPQPTSTPSR